MERYELIVQINGENQYLDTYEGVGISLNYNIADIKDISAKNSSYSKTITLPDSKTNRTTFEYIFNVNSDSTFDPTKKSKCWVLKDTNTVFEGYLQLTSITYDYNTNKNEYEVLIFADNDTLFKNIGEKYLTDLDLNQYNHIYGPTAIINSWTVSSDRGYYYPLINYAYPLDYTVVSSGGSTGLTTSNFMPSVFVKPVVKQIILEAGFSVNSDFLESDFLEHLVIPFSNKTITPVFPGLLFDSNNKLFEAHIGASAGTYDTLTSVTDYKWGNFNCNVVDYNENNFYNIATHSYTNTMSYPILQKFRIDVGIEFNSGYVTMLPWAGVGDNIQLIVKRSMDASGTLVSGWGDTPGNPEIFPPSSGGLPAVTFGGNDQLILANEAGYLYPGITLNAVGTMSGYTLYGLSGTVYTDDVIVRPGEQIRFFFGRFNYPSGVVPVTYGTSSNHISSTYVSNYVLNDISIVDVSASLPANVKQKDFLSSFFKLFNIYMDVDKNNDNTFIMEPRDYYYNKYRVIKDWRSKLDISQPITSQITSDTQNRTNTFKYKEDKDVYNTSYTSNTHKTYGEYVYEIDNDFISDEKTIEPIFSGTPIDRLNGSNEIYLPSIANLNNGNYVRPEGMNIRILYAKRKTLISDVIKYNSITFNSYPYIGPFDDPLTPSVSLNFGDVTSFYPNFYDTNNNLFYNYYQNQMTEISDKNSRIITAYFNLNSVDISNFRFSDLIFLTINGNDGYYRVNKIIDYDPSVNNLTKVELIKANDYIIPSNPVYIRQNSLPYQIPPGQALVGNISLSTTNVITDSVGAVVAGRFNNVSGNNNIVSGLNNRVVGNNNTVYGDNHSISGDNLFIHGNNIAVSGTLSNSYAIGDNITLTASNTFNSNVPTYFSAPVTLTNTLTGGNQFDYSVGITGSGLYVYGRGVKIATSSISRPSGNYDIFSFSIPMGLMSSSFSKATIENVISTNNTGGIIPFYISVESINATFSDISGITTSKVNMIEFDADVYGAKFKFNIERIGENSVIIYPETPSVGVNVTQYYPYGIVNTDMFILNQIQDIGFRVNCYGIGVTYSAAQYSYCVRGDVTYYR